jgi:hypothetical protein
MQMSGEAEKYELRTSLVSVAEATTVNPEPSRSSAVAMSSQLMAQDSATKTEIRLSCSFSVAIMT